ncbi:IL23A protein, partial [Dicaeum eximium]|nr:IL23A protein [Dicaeum eximium]
MAPLRRLRLCLLLALLPPPPAAPAPAPAPAPGRRVPGMLRIRLEVPEGSQRCRESPGGAGGGLGRVPDPHLTPRSPQRCLQRIRQALQHYRDLLGSDIFREQPQPELQSAMEQLLRHVQLWALPLKRHLALNRLRSFAALMSRVFNHSAR